MPSLQAAGRHPSWDEASTASAGLSPVYGELGATHTPPRGARRRASPDTPRRRKKVTTDQSLARRAAAAMLIFSVASVLDEGIILRIVERGPHHYLGWFLALIQTPTLLLPPLLQRCRRRSGRRSSVFRGYNRGYLFCGVGACVTHGMASAAVMHVNYTEQQLFKSAKVAFVMIASHFMLRVRTTNRAITFAALLCGGLAIFSIADFYSFKLSEQQEALAGGEAELSAGFAPPPTTTRFDWTGVMMLTASLACSGVVNVTQALVMQKKPSSLRLTLPCTACGMEEFSVLEHGQGAPGEQNCTAGKSSAAAKNDLLYFQSLISFPLLLLVSWWYGEVTRGVRFFASAGPSLLLQQLASLALYYAGTHVVYGIARDYGATTASIIVASRRVVSFALSVVLFPKPFTALHGLGLLMAVLGAFMLQQEMEGKDPTGRKSGSKKLKMRRHDSTQSLPWVANPRSDDESVPARGVDFHHPALADSMLDDSDDEARSPRAATTAACEHRFLPSVAALPECTEGAAGTSGAADTAAPPDMAASSIPGSSAASSEQLTRHLDRFYSPPLMPKTAALRDMPPLHLSQSGSLDDLSRPFASLDSAKAPFVPLSSVGRPHFSHENLYSMAESGPTLQTRSLTSASSDRLSPPVMEPPWDSGHGIVRSASATDPSTPTATHLRRCRRACQEGERPRSKARQNLVRARDQDT